MKGSHLKKYAPHALIIAGLIFFYYFRYRRAPEIDFPNLSVTQNDGSVVKLGTLLHEKSVIHFYASWCGPCIKEMNDIRKEWETLQQNDIQFVFVTDDTQERIEPFRSKMPDGALFLQIPSLQEAGIYTIPTSYFLYQQEITSKGVDALDWKNHEDIDNRFKQ